MDRSDGAIPTLRAPHLARGAITIDGRLDEPAWQRAGSTGGFVSPSDGRAVPDSRVNGSARLAWDDEALYVAVIVNDPHPSTPFRASEVDPHLWERSSAIELMLQPGDAGDNRDYYEVQVDTAGAIWDTHFDDYNQPITGPESSRRFGHQEWLSHLRQASLVDRDNGRYAIEFALPWSSITGARSPVPPHPGDVWRVNLYSFRDGQSDSLGWSPLMHQGNFHRATRFGRVEFVAE